MKQIATPGMCARSRLPTMLGLTVFMAACSTMPAQNAALDSARRDYVDSAADPNVAGTASLELRQASEALDLANEAWQNHVDAVQVDRLAHIAHQKVEIAKEVSRRKIAERQIADASGERDRLLAEQRTAQMQSARQAAQTAQEQAYVARQQAQEATARAQQLQQQLQDLSPKTTERGTVITFGSVMFNPGSSQINPGGTLKLREVADVLKQNPQRKVLVEGFTDSTGSAEANEVLSERRAENIRSALADMGVPAERIETRGYGEAFPIADNRTPVGRQLNRRVEIVISDDSGRIGPRVAAAN